MALIEPNSIIEFLVGIPFDPSYENTMYFADLAEQESYFATKIGVTVKRSSYQRESGYIKVGWVVDTVGLSVINQMYNANYMRFKNTNFENKWFYAFVDKVEYINNNTVAVYYHLDVLQTWHFDYSFNECFIERQHTETDNIGENTIPEDLELGDYVLENIYDYPFVPTAIVVTAGLLSGEYSPGYLVNGLTQAGNSFSGVHFYAYDISNPDRLSALNSMLEAAYTNRNEQNTIIAIFMYYSYFMQGNKVPLVHSVSLPSSNGAYSFNGYFIRNKKLLTHPYNFIYVTNYQGNSAVYKYEYFSNPAQCDVKVWGSTGVNPGLILYPYNYKMTGDNFDESITLTGFPMCSWVNDAYKAWVAQNAGTINAGIFAAGVSWGDTIIKGKTYLDERSGRIGIGKFPHLKNSGEVYREMLGYEDRAKGDFASSLGRSLIATAGIVGQMRDHAVRPPQAHGNQNADVMFQSGKMTFMVGNKHIRPEYASIIDKYFDMYGYAVHKSGIPNRNARPCYTFVKTVGCSLDGNVPVEDLRLIEEIYNSGIRFWKTSATFGVYNPNINYNYPS